LAVDPRLALPGSSDTLNLGVSVVVIKGVTLRYLTMARLVNFEFLQHTAGVTLGSACSDCWRLDLSISEVPNQNKSFFNSISGFHYSLELKNLGVFGG
jgi:hypothetical protein